MSRFTNKTIWVTGATSGIGEALVYAFSEEGAKLVVSARRVEELERVKGNCKGEVLVLPLDLTKMEEFAIKTKQVIEKFGKIDYLINNGGLSQRSEAWETSLDIDREIMEVNYFGNIALTKAVLPQMQQQKSGHIITISSLSGKFGFYLRSAYSASKFALVGFYESLRLEEEKNSIQVSIVFPGFIKTNISKNALSKEGKSTGKMDNNQNQGVTAEKCAKQIIRGIEKNKMEIFAGAGELKAITLKRLVPKIFYKILRKQNAT